MKIFYWLIIIMDITLIILLWLYIYDFYIQDRFNGFEYADHIFSSDEAIPVIGLGVLLNTGALIFAMFDSRRRRETPASEMEKPRSELEKTGDQDEILKLEAELEEVVRRLDELRKSGETRDRSG